MSIQKPIIDSQEPDHSSSSEEEESSNEQNESMDLVLNNGSLQNFIPGSINPIGNLFQFQTIPNYYVPYFSPFTSNNTYFQPTLYNPFLNLQIPYYYNPYLQYLPLYSQPILNDPMMYLNSPYYFPNINIDYMIQPQQILNPILTKSTSRKHHKKSQQKSKTKKSKSISKSPKNKITASSTATSSNSIIKQETPIENKIKQETPIEIKIKPYCTFAATGREFYQQALYECETCKRNGKFNGFGEGICEVCARTCHQGHDVHFRGMQTGCLCYCPLKCNCQSNPPNPDLTCTMKLTGGKPISQPMYFCKKCSKNICQNCAVREHRWHDLIYKGTVQNAICHNDNLNQTSFMFPLSTSSLSGINNSQNPGHEVQINLSHGDENLFKGIIHHLTKKCGGNVGKRGVVKITGSSYLSNSYEPFNVADLDNANSCFESNNNPNSWICYDFIDSRVKPNAYSIRSCMNGDGHMKSWAFEGSDDNTWWSPLDQQTNSPIFNGPNKKGSFVIQNNNFYRYLRIRQTGMNALGMHILNLSAFEIFGTLKE